MLACVRFLMVKEHSVSITFFSEFPLIFFCSRLLSLATSNASLVCDCLIQTNSCFSVVFLNRQLTAVETKKFVREQIMPLDSLLLENQPVAGSN